MTKIQFVVGNPFNGPADQPPPDRVLSERVDRHAMCMTPGGCRRTGMHGKGGRS